MSSVSLQKLRMGIETRSIRLHNVRNCIAKYLVTIYTISNIYTLVITLYPYFLKSSSSRIKRPDDLQCDPPTLSQNVESLLDIPTAHTASFSASPNTVP